MDPGKRDAVSGLCGGRVGREGVFCMNMCVFVMCLCISKDTQSGDCGGEGGIH